MDKKKGVNKLSENNTKKIRTLKEKELTKILLLKYANALVEEQNIVRISSDQLPHNVVLSNSQDDGRELENTTSSPEKVMPDIDTYREELQKLTAGIFEGAECPAPFMLNTIFGGLNVAVIHGNRISGLINPLHIKEIKRQKDLIYTAVNMMEMLYNYVEREKGAA